MHAKLHRAIAQVPHLRRALGIVWTAAPPWAVAWTILVLGQGILPVAPVYLTRRLVNLLLAAKAAGGTPDSLAPVLLVAGIIAVILLLSEVLQNVTDWVRVGLSELVQDHVSGLIHAKAMQVDVAFYDSADYYDRLYRARTEAKTRPLALLENLGALGRNAITLLAMIALLLRYGAWLPLALVVGTLPAFLVVLRFNRRYHAWWQGATADHRLAEYADGLVTHAAAAAELRLFGLGDHFATTYQSLRRGLRSERVQLARDQGLARLGAGLAGLAVSGVAMVYMVARAIRGTTTLGDLALFYQAFNQGQGLLRALLRNVGEVYSNSFFLGDLFAFLALEPRVIDPGAPLPTPPAPLTGIRFRDVTFRYPGTRNPVLRQFDLAIPAGRTTAIVGPNGAGKSTLIKLLCRFYDPEAGRIEWDGNDLRELSLAELRRRITVLFQFPLTYAATAAQNIAMGDLAARPTDAAIEAAARAAGAHDIIARLPHGYATPLGRAFGDGTDLSGGEWQRVALARAFLRQAPIIVLDEPTSFMDSWAEAEWLERLDGLIRGRTVLIITHRFTTAKRADVIHVMQGGQLVESGSHAELVERGGLYAQSWATQTALVPAAVG